MAVLGVRLWRMASALVLVSDVVSSDRRVLCGAYTSRIYVALIAQARGYRLGPRATRTGIQIDPD